MVDYGAITEHTCVTGYLGPCQRHSETHYTERPPTCPTSPKYVPYQGYECTVTESYLYLRGHAYLSQYAYDDVGVDETRYEVHILSIHHALISAVSGMTQQHIKHGYPALHGIEVLLQVSLTRRYVLLPRFQRLFFCCFGS